MICLLLYAPARFERLTNGIESRLRAAQRFIFIDFTATPFGGIPCTRFPWIRCYDFAQFLLTLFTNHFQSILRLLLSDFRLVFRLIVLDGPLWSIWMGLFCFICRFRVSVVKCQTAKPTRFNVNVSISIRVPFCPFAMKLVAKTKSMNRRERCPLSSLIDGNNNTFQIFIRCANHWTVNWTRWKQTHTIRVGPRLCVYAACV